MPRLTRRRFLVAAGAAALPIGARAQLTAPSNLAIRQGALAWKNVPTLNFTQGVAGRIRVAGDYVTDARTIRQIAGKLPPGVTFDGRDFVYDGTTGPAVGTGIVLEASDGSP